VESRLKHHPVRLRILFATHYYPPELGAPQTRIHQIARHLTERGHDVTVLTGFPNYPTGVVPEGYRGMVLMREEIDSVRVLRTWIYPTETRVTGAA
jgi:colanic acid biosynthesis glycosyl transferase WcaI